MGRRPKNYTPPVDVSCYATEEPEDIGEAEDQPEPRKDLRDNPRRILMAMEGSLGNGTRKCHAFMGILKAGANPLALKVEDIDPAPDVAPGEIETLVGNPHLWRVE